MNSEVTVFFPVARDSRVYEQYLNPWAAPQNRRFRGHFYRVAPIEN